MVPVENLAIIHKSQNIVFFMIFEPFLHTNALYALLQDNLLLTGEHYSVDHYPGHQTLSLTTFSNNHILLNLLIGHLFIAWI